MRDGLVHLIIYHCRRANTTPPHLISRVQPFPGPSPKPLPLCSLHSKGPKLAKVTDDLFAVKTFPSPPWPLKCSAFFCIPPSLAWSFSYSLTPWKRALVDWLRLISLGDLMPKPLTGQMMKLRLREDASSHKPGPAPAAISTVTAGEVQVPSLLCHDIPACAHTAHTRVHACAHINRSSNRAELLPHEVAFTFPLLCLCSSGSLYQKCPSPRLIETPRIPPPPGSLL